MIRNFSIFLLLGLCILVTSCAKKTIGELALVKVERKKVSELVNHIDSISKKVPTTFYSKISTSYKDTNQELSFKTSVRMIKDSAVTALISYAGIPLVNAIITNDSLQFTNKKERCYVKSNLKMLKQEFGVDFDFKNVQELLLGLPLGYHPNQKYYQIHDPYTYIVSSHRKREIKKMERKNFDDYIMKYYFNNDSLGIKRIEIENNKDSTYIVVNYKTKKKVENYWIPSEVEVMINTKKNHILIQLEYEKIAINEEQEIYFTIPENYEACN
jgi:hypothetical protein